MKPFWKDEQSIKHRVGTEPRRCFGFGLLCLFKIDFFFPYENWDNLSQIPEAQMNPVFKNSRGLPFCELK